MKKKLLVVFSVIIVLICAVLAVLQTKTNWNTDVENYGPLNMNFDEDFTSNDFSFWYEITSPKDFVVLNNISIIQGEAKITIYFNEEVIFEENFEEGEHVIETDEISGVTGDVTVDVKLSDDVKGTYSIKINTRQKRLYKLKQRIKEYFF